ncbi:MAG: hypothetical protein ABSC57_00880 [Syntrophales bacterium]
MISLVSYNNYNNISLFIYPLFMLLSIPLFADLFEKYGIERYLQHLLFAIIILATETCVIYFITAENRHIAQWINDHWNIFEITYPDIGLRVFSRTSAFFPSGLLLAGFFLLRERKVRYWSYFFVVSYALYLNHSIAVIMAGLVTVYLFVIINIKSGITKMLIVILGICLVFIIGVTYLNYSYSYKMRSIDLKVQQTSQAMELFSEKPIIGQGLGFVYHQMDERGTDDVMLEVSYMTIIVSTGILGGFFYLFIYLYYPIVCLIKNNSYRIYINLLLLCFLSILVAGIGNPFIFSGGMGLFFIVLLGATVDSRGKIVLVS